MALVFHGDEMGHDVTLTNFHDNGYQVLYHILMALAATVLMYLFCVLYIVSYLRR